MESPILFMVSIKPLLLDSAQIFNPMYLGSGVSCSLFWRKPVLESSSVAFVARRCTQLKLVNWEIERLSVFADTSSKESALWEHGPSRIMIIRAFTDAGTLLTWQLLGKEPSNSLVLWFKMSLLIIPAARARCSASESLSHSQAFVMTSPMCWSNANTTSLPRLYDIRSGISASSFSLSRVVCSRAIWSTPWSSNTLQYTLVLVMGSWYWRIYAGRYSAMD